MYASSLNSVAFMRIRLNDLVANLIVNHVMSEATPAPVKRPRRYPNAVPSGRNQIVKMIKMSKIISICQIIMMKMSNIALSICWQVDANS
jgi:hypothetical protein